ncbi:hypothetical protein QBC45DRAFT_373944 [Copromyces sp. CBS 386.78]|nr:hypothetical protein QBC45DRAFT_373944 [Copromyces sp. CBS 386.78]
MTIPPAGRAPQILGVAGFFLALSTTAILLRCYCRVFVVKKFGVDDWSALIAWLFFVFYISFCITACYHGSGQHAIDVPPTELPLGLKWWWACEPVYVLSNMALRLSIGVQLLRIAVSRTHRLIIYTAVTVFQVCSVAFFLLFVMQCLPSKFFWTRFLGDLDGKCINPEITVNATYAYSAVSCATDWTLGLLPISLVWHLQMTPRTKLMVAAILALGAVASTATIVRMPYVKDMSNQLDFLYACTDVAIWSTAETGIGIAASAIATLRPLARSFLARSKLFGGSTTPHGGGPSGSHHWPTSMSKGGYVRSRSAAQDGSGDEFGLREDIGRNRGVTTVVESGKGGGHGVRRSMSGRSDSVGPLTSGGGSGKDDWNSSETKLTDISSDDGLNSGSGWPKGIRTTTVTTQNVIETGTSPPVPNGPLHG